MHSWLPRLSLHAWCMRPLLERRETSRCGDKTLTCDQTLSLTCGVERAAGAHDSRGAGAALARGLGGLWEVAGGRPWG